MPNAEKPLLVMTKNASSVRSVLRTVSTEGDTTPGKCKISRLSKCCGS